MKERLEMNMSKALFFLLLLTVAAISNLARTSRAVGFSGTSTSIEHMLKK
jgi:hypothetical protein